MKEKQSQPISLTIELHVRSAFIRLGPHMYRIFFKRGGGEYDSAYCLPPWRPWETETGRRSPYTRRTNWRRKRKEPTVPWRLMLSLRAAACAYLYEVRVTFGEDMFTPLPYGVRTVKTEGGKISNNGRPFYFMGYGKHEDTFPQWPRVNMPMNTKDISDEVAGANSPAPAIIRTAKR